MNNNLLFNDLILNLDCLVYARINLQAEAIFIKMNNYDQLICKYYKTLEDCFEAFNEIKKQTTKEQFIILDSLIINFNKITFLNKDLTEKNLVFKVESDNTTERHSYNNVGDLLQDWNILITKLHCDCKTNEL